MAVNLLSAKFWARTALALGIGVLADGSAAEPPDDIDIPRIRTRQFEVHFETTEADTVRSVELWYTLDGGRRWERFEFESSPRRGPLPFVAPQEGLCGLFVIIKNRAGPSSPPPRPGTQPQQWCFVDWTPPLVQLHLAERDEAFATTRRIALRWTAYDAHLLNRPVDLYYMVKGQRMWIPIELRLPNSGRYDWRVPDQVGGEIVIKLTVSDRGGHVVERFSERMTIGASIRPTPEREAVVVPTSLVPRVLANRPLSAASVGGMAPLAKDRPSPPRTTEVSGPSGPTSRPANSKAGRAVTTFRSRQERAPAPPAPPAAIRPKRRVLARIDAPKRVGGTTTKSTAPRRWRAAGSKTSRNPFSRPTTVASAVIGPTGHTSQASVTPDRVRTPSAADVARALRLYKAGTYYRIRGQHEGQRGDLAIAALRYQEALRADPTFLDARQDLAGVLSLQGRYAEAAEMYKALLVRAPGHRGALQGLAFTMARRRQYVPAKATLMRLVGLYPNNGEAWLDLGDVCHRMGDLGSARDYWAKAALLVPNNSDIAERARKRLGTYTPLPLARP